MHSSGSLESICQFAREENFLVVIVEIVTQMLIIVNHVISIDSGLDVAVCLDMVVIFIHLACWNCWKRWPALHNSDDSFGPLPLPELLILRTEFSIFISLVLHSTLGHQQDHTDIHLHQHSCIR